jgi:hypothetical protein
VILSQLGSTCHGHGLGDSYAISLVLTVTLGDGIINTNLCAQSSYVTWPRSHSRGSRCVRILAEMPLTPKLRPFDFGQLGTYAG